MFSELTSKIYGALVIILIIGCTALYFNKMSLEKDIITKDGVISSVTKERDTLLSEKNNREVLNESADEITLKKNNAQKELANHRDSALSELDKLTNKKEPKGTQNVAKNPSSEILVQDSNNDATLDPNIARVLNQLCARVRGNACPNP
jgi:hypothetical protein